MNPEFLVDFPGLGINDLPISREAFSLFNVPIYWYGLLISFAIILCLLLALRQAPKFQLKSDDIIDVFIAIVPLTIIFARLYYVIFEWGKYASDWTSIFNIRQGGLGFYGGVIGGVIAIILVARLKKIPLYRYMDFLAVYLPLGQAIGRWGNFFNQEAFGTNTTLPWGMYSNQTQAYLAGIGGSLIPTAPVHPTFLYEFIANMIIFVILLRIRKTSKTPYAVTLWYLLSYGFVRFFVEGLRTDPLLIGDTGIRISQIVSVLMVVGSIILLIVTHQRRLSRELAAAQTGDSGDEAPAESENEETPVFVEINDENDAATPEPPANSENKD